MLERSLKDKPEAHFAFSPVQPFAPPRTPLVEEILKSLDCFSRLIAKIRYFVD